MDKINLHVMCNLKCCKMHYFDIFLISYPYTIQLQCLECLFHRNQVCESQYTWSIMTEKTMPKRYSIGYLPPCLSTGLIWVRNRVSFIVKTKLISCGRKLLKIPNSRIPETISSGNIFLSVERSCKNSLKIYQIRRSVWNIFLGKLLLTFPDKFLKQFKWNQFW